MSKDFGKLKQLPVNKTVVFRSPIEDDDVLVRTGVVCDSSSFFHSIMHAYSKEYASMDEKGRVKLVRRLRSSLSGKIDRESWEEMDGELIAKIPFQENVSDIILNCYRFLTDDQKARGISTHRVIKTLVKDDENILESYKLITKLIPYKTFENNILQYVYSKSEKQKIADLCDEIIFEVNYYVKTKKNILKENFIFLSDITNKFIEAVLKEAQDEAFKNYVEGSNNLINSINTYTVNIVSKRFNRDIYFLDGKHRLPYNNSSTTDHIKGRKSIVLIWLGGDKYEVVGRLLPGNSIQRDFDHDDIIIEKLYTFLVEPEKIADKFYNLVQYLPEDYKKKSSSSDEDETENSDSNSDSD
jgi:hypothetical protein